MRARVSDERGVTLVTVLLIVAIFLLIGLIIAACKAKQSVDAATDQLSAKVDKLSQEWKGESEAWRSLVEKILLEFQGSREEICQKLEQIKDKIDKSQLSADVKLKLKSSLEEKCKK